MPELERAKTTWLKAFGFCYCTDSNIECAKMWWVWWRANRIPVEPNWTFPLEAIEEVPTNARLPLQGIKAGASCGCLIWFTIYDSDYVPYDWPTCLSSHKLPLGPGRQALMDQLLSTIQVLLLDPTAPLIPKGSIARVFNLISNSLLWLCSYNWPNCLTSHKLPLGPGR